MKNLQEIFAIIENNLPCKAGAVPLNNGEEVGDELFGGELTCLNDEAINFISSINLEDLLKEFDREGYREFNFVIKKNHTIKERGEFNIYCQSIN